MTRTRWEDNSVVRTIEHHGEGAWTNPQTKGHGFCLALFKAPGVFTTIGGTITYYLHDIDDSKGLCTAAAVFTTFNTLADCCGLCLEEECKTFKTFNICTKMVNSIISIANPALLITLCTLMSNADSKHPLTESMDKVCKGMLISASILNVFLFLSLWVSVFSKASQTGGRGAEIV